MNPSSAQPSVQQIGLVPAQSVDAEYRWLDQQFGAGRYRLTMQSLVANQRGTFDRIDVLAADGRRYAVWFDISSFVNLPALRAAGQAAAGQAAQPAPVPAPTPTTGESCPVCPSLPSSESAYKAYRGEPDSLILLARDWLFRGFLIGSGMYIAGEREHVVRNALAGSLAIETFVLGWIAYSNRPVSAPAARAARVRKYPWETAAMLQAVPALARAA